MILAGFRKKSTMIIPSSTAPGMCSDSAKPLYLRRIARFPACLEREAVPLFFTPEFPQP